MAPREAGGPGAAATAPGCAEVNGARLRRRDLETGAHLPWFRERAVGLFVRVRVLGPEEGGPVYRVGHVVAVERRRDFCLHAGSDAFDVVLVDLVPQFCRAPQRSLALPYGVEAVADDDASAEEVHAWSCINRLGGGPPRVDVSLCRELQQSLRDIRSLLGIAVLTGWPGAELATAGSRAGRSRKRRRPSGAAAAPEAPRRLRAPPDDGSGPESEGAEAPYDGRDASASASDGDNFGEDEVREAHMRMSCPSSGRSSPSDLVVDLSFPDSPPPAPGHRAPEMIDIVSENAADAAGALEANLGVLSVAATEADRLPTPRPTKSKRKVPRKAFRKDRHPRARTSMLADFLPAHQEAASMDSHEDGAADAGEASKRSVAKRPTKKRRTAAAEALADVHAESHARVAAVARAAAHADARLASRRRSADTDDEAPASRALDPRKREMLEERARARLDFEGAVKPKPRPPIYESAARVGVEVPSEVLGMDYVEAAIHEARKNDAGRFHLERLVAQRNNLPLEGGARAFLDRLDARVNISGDRRGFSSPAKPALPIPREQRHLALSPQAPASRTFSLLGRGATPSQSLSRAAEEHAAEAFRLAVLAERQRAETFRARQEAEVLRARRQVEALRAQREAEGFRVRQEAEILHARQEAEALRARREAEVSIAAAAAAAAAACFPAGPEWQGHRGRDEAWGERANAQLAALHRRHLPPPPESFLARMAVHGGLEFM